MEGLTSEQLKRLQELFVMANDHQLAQIRIYISMEIDKRANTRRWIESKKDLRGDM